MHKGRLTWRCRRGMKELDVLLTAWLERNFERATADARQRFAELLELPDPVLAEWLLEREAPTPEFATLVQAIQLRCAGGE